MLAEDLVKGLEAGQSLLICDVRSGLEYRQGHIPGAVHMPFWTIPFRRHQLDVQDNMPVVVYCEHGPRAVVAARLLRRAGFRQVETLTGHMHAWRQNGYPLE